MERKELNECKVGDQFIFNGDPNKASSSKLRRGDIVTLRRDDGTNLPWFDSKEQNAICIDIASLKPLRPRRFASANHPKLILQYDDMRYEVFTSEKELRARITELSKEPVANRTFTVYDVKRTRTAEIGVKITLK